MQRTFAMLERWKNHSAQGNFADAEARPPGNRLVAMREDD